MSRPQGANLDFQLQSRILNLLAPVALNEPARLADLNAAIEAIKWKDARVRAQSNVNLASPGATIDGVAMVVGDKFLAPLQSTGSQIGLYRYNGAAVAATRDPSADTSAELTNAVVSISEGTDAGANWRQSIPNPTVDTTTLNFTAFGTSTPPASTTVSGSAVRATQADVDGGTVADEFVTPETLANWSKRAKGFDADFGDGSALTYTLTHNLGTRAVIVQVFRNSDYTDVDVEIARTTINTVTVSLASAPALNALHAVIAKAPA